MSPFSSYPGAKSPRMTPTNNNSRGAFNSPPSSGGYSPFRRFNGGKSPTKRNGSSSQAAAKIFPLFVLVIGYSLFCTAKFLSSHDQITGYEPFDFSLGEYDPSRETEDMDGEAFLTNLNPNRTYTGDCKNRYLFNQTWGKSAAAYVDKNLAKEVVRRMNVPDLKIPRTIAYFNDANVSLFTKEFFSNISQGMGAVIKPAHTSGGVGQVVDGTYQCFKKCKKEAKRIMPLEPGYYAARQNLVADLTNLYHKAYIETQYQFLDRGILVEERLPMKDMMEYHWWVVRGHPIFVCLRCKAMGQPAGSYFSTRFERLNIKMEGLPQCPMKNGRPKTWDRMVTMVQELGRQIEEVGIVRIDLYASDTDIYFSEFTFTSNGCRFFYDPLVADSLLYAAMYGHLTKEQLTAEFIEQSVNSRLWFIVPLLHEPNPNQQNKTFNAIYDPSMITDHPNDWTTCRRVKFHKQSDFAERCMQHVNMEAYQKYPIRCAGVTDDNMFIVGQWRVPSFGAAFVRVDWQWGFALGALCLVLWIMGIGEETVPRMTRIKVILAYLFAVTVYKYLQPSNVGWFAPGSLWRTAQESYQTFVVVHPATSPLLGWMHVGTYWFQIAAWRSKTLRGVLFWYFMYEFVASFLNEYFHIAEEDNRRIRCLRVTFIYATKQFAVNDVLRAYLLPPIFVYLYLLPQLVLQWLPYSTSVSTELVQ